ncbi:MAG: CvpA family protein [Bacteroidaceae bacterium]|jgi:membrane protein required for colicin V production|nr:CvpA family protein [Bacteroidaceae bacterium]
MNGFDILFVLVLVVGAWKGWSNGLLKEVLGLIGVFVGLYVAHLLYEQVGYELAPRIGTSPSMASIVAFALIWMGVPILLGILGSLLTKVLEWIGLEGVNNLGGALVSVIKYAIILGALCNVLAITHLVKEESQQNSILFEPLKRTTSIAFDLAKTQWQKADDSHADE